MSEPDRTEPELSVVLAIDVRRAEKDIDHAAAWIASRIQERPGSLIDVANYGNDGNRIHIKVADGDEAHENDRP